jgi:apolipoprotein N-acyltransferase
VSRLAAALGAGALVALALPPWGWWPLSIVGIALFDHLVCDVERPGGRWQLGTAFGLGWLAPGMGWMWFLTPPGYLIASIGFAALHGVAAMIPARGATHRVVLRPAAHMLVEALRFVAPFGGVPLASLAMVHASSPLVWLGRWGGPLLVTWAALAMGVALAVALQRGASWRAPACAVALVVVMVLGAVWLPFTHDTGRSLRVAAVQGGGPQGTLAIDTSPGDVLRRHLDATSTISTDEALDLVLWPENVIATGDIPFSDSDAHRAVVAEAERLNTPLVVGITERPRPGRFTNAQVVVEPNGAITDRYDKVQRVPFGEYMPLRGLLAAVGAPVDRVPTDAIAGTGPAYLDLGDDRLAVVISWEVFFGHRARDGVGKGGTVLVNPTNGSSYTGTILQTQQVASSRLRAVETGRWLVQVAPTGFSAVISASGEVRERTAVSERHVIIAEIPLRTGMTPYARGGDAPVIVAGAAVVISNAMLSRRRRARPASPSPDHR